MRDNKPALEKATQLFAGEAYKGGSRKFLVKNVPQGILPGTPKHETLKTTPTKTYNLKLFNTF